LIEDKANGSAVIDALGKRLPGLIPVDPLGGKVARAYAVEPIFESGNVWLPDPDNALWVHDYIEELVSFNGDPGRRDDQTDATTQALSYLYNQTVDRYAAAMRTIAGVGAKL
jgi:predicted phage terminase large subunit-like protein